MSRAVAILAALMTGAVAAVGGWGVVMFSKLRTGFPNLDALRIPLIAALARQGLISAQYGRAMMAIFHNEHTNGNVTHDVGAIGSGGPTDPLTMGDTTLPGGPSIGPGQVYFKTAWELGLWDKGDRDGYIAFGSDPANLGKMVDMAVQVFKSKLKMAGGDVASAIELYNGAGDSARLYQANALAFESQVYGGQS